MVADINPDAAVNYQGPYRDPAGRPVTSTETSTADAVLRTGFNHDDDFRTLHANDATPQLDVTPGTPTDPAQLSNVQVGVTNNGVYLPPSPYTTGGMDYTGLS